MGACILSLGAALESCVLITWAPVRTTCRNSAGTHADAQLARRLETVGDLKLMQGLFDLLPRFELLVFRQATQHLLQRAERLALKLGTDGRRWQTQRCGHDMGLTQAEARLPVGLLHHDLLAQTERP